MGNSIMRYFRQTVPSLVTLIICAGLWSVGGVGAAGAGMPVKTCLPDGENSGTNITLLGTAGGPNSKRMRSQPASLLTVEGEHYLIDAGDGVARQLARARVPLPGIKQIFITHLHGDHVAGLGPLMMFDWTSGSTRAIGIYGPPGTKMFAKAAMDYISIPVEIFRSQYPPVPQLSDLFSGVEPDVKEGLEPTLIYSDDKVKVSAIENSHYVTMKKFPRLYGRDRAYSYRFDTEGRSVVFTGDTGPSDALITLAKDADVLVTEVIDIERQVEMMYEITGFPKEKMKSIIAHMREEHITPVEIGKLAAAASVKQVILTHVVPGLDGETDFSPYMKGIRKYYKGPVSIGQDFDCF